MAILWPKQSPEPAAVLSNRSFGGKADGACSSAITAHAASLRWPSFGLGGCRYVIL
jgi:hypothetical protein